MSENMNDEFVLFPSSSDSANAITDARYPGSHDPGYSGDSGRHHRPTGPCDTLRCSEAGDDSGTSGAVRGADLNTVNGSFRTDGLHGNKGDRQGNSVIQCPQEGSEFNDPRPPG